MEQNTVSSRGFTLVELLVVITILAIISITAYTSFSGSTDKAKNSTKIGHIASIETGLNTFYVEKNYYPTPSVHSATNLWGYDTTKNATVSNIISVTKVNDQISTVNATSVGGGKIMDTAGTAQIGAKGTIDADILPKQYLSQDLADPSLKDVKVGDTATLKDSGIGEYVYGVYAKGITAADWTTPAIFPTIKKSSAYNVAITVADDQKGMVTKVSGNFDKSTCISCPNTLIGGGGVANNNLKDGESYNGSTFDANTRVAYPISGF